MCLKTLSGGCHCGNLSLTFSSPTDLDSLQLRECQCGFCRRHGVRTVTDPDGQLTVRVGDRQKLSAYSFGQNVARFMVCRDCGTYVAAVMETGTQSVATLNINTLDGNPFGVRHGDAANYSSESAEQRAARRVRMWTPARVKYIS